MLNASDLVSNSHQEIKSAEKKLLNCVFTKSLKKRMELKGISAVNYKEKQDASSYKKKRSRH